MALAIWNSTITDQQGNVIPNARVEVRRESDGALVALYSDRNGTVGKGNPFNADGAGFVYFHCIGGAYRITATGAGQTQQWRYVPIGTAQELDAGAFSENAGWNAVENTPAGLANHTSAAAGYRVLVINADGNGRAAVYEKMGAGANWSAPIWITGVQGSNGAPNTLSIGTVTQTTTPQVTLTGETPNQVLNFGLVKGDTGDVTPAAIAARDAAISAKNSAESSAASATASASTATTKASEASASATAASSSQTAAAGSAATAVTNATNAGNSAAAALASANSATASAGTATTKASEASASADVAYTHRQAAAGSASSAASSATEADTAKTGAETARTQAAASATGAAGSATTAGNSASAASGSASTATTQATNAGNSATAASASASTANTAKTDAQAAAVVASTKAGESASSATASAGSATTSATRAGESAVSASNSANSASAAAGSAGTATTKASEATTARDYAYQWSSAPQDTQVNDGTHTGFSAYHWSKVAENAAGGGIISVNGKTGSAITLDAADVGALATLVAGTNITITGTDTSRTINATVGAQVNADWSAESGVAKILNKPVLGTASAQNVSAFATSAQGVKADSALQTLTAGTNVTVVKSGTSYTINATSSPQVQSDWSATSGLGVILNKPTLGTAAAQDVGYFATSAQGAKADTAVQTVNGIAPTGGNVNVSGSDQLLSPESFGAIGDGVTDDISAINQVIAAAGKDGLIYLGNNKTYYVSSTPVNTYGVSFLGQGVITVVKKLYRSYADDIGFGLGREYLSSWLTRVFVGSSYKIFLYGDSTVSHGNGELPEYNPALIVDRLLLTKGIRAPFTVTNKGVGGTVIGQLNAIPDLSADTKLIFIKYGINDGGAPLATRLDTFNNDLRSKLASIRSAANGSVNDVAIVLLGPTSCFDDGTNKNELWMEQLRDIYRNAARDYKCVYFDSYAYLQDSRAISNSQWMLDQVHPGNVATLYFWGGMVDWLFSDCQLVLWKNNNFINHDAGTAPILKNKKPSQFLRGITINRALSPEWPHDGSVITTATADGVVRQVNIPFDPSKRQSSCSRSGNVWSGDSWNGFTGVNNKLTLSGSWVNFGDNYAEAEYTVHETGQISISGTIKSGAVTGPVATIPAIYAPAKRTIFVVATSGGFSAIQIDPDGIISSQRNLDATYTTLQGTWQSKNS